MSQKDTSLFFLHGLESSGNGTKGQFFAQHLPQMQRPDFKGPLASRLSQLEILTKDETELILIGSSYGGLMASCFAEKNCKKIKKLILLAPALNFEGYTPPAKSIDVPVLVVIGRHDDVTPINPVVDLAKRSFKSVTIWICEDDHMLHKIFPELNWKMLLDPAVSLSAITPPAGVVPFMNSTK